MTVSGLLVAVNNWMVRRRRGRIRPEGVLLLLPGCLQRSGCAQDVRSDVGNCQRCGQCPVGEVLAAAEELGVRAVMASGGELALEEARKTGVEGVVAVACAKELGAGILRLWSKPVLALENYRPNGPCRDTRVELAAVVSAIELLLGGGAGGCRAEDTVSLDS